MSTSSKDIATINKFKRLVINEGDNGLRKISKILNEKELKSFKVTKSEFKQSDKFLSDSLKNSILIATPILVALGLQFASGWKSVKDIDEANKK